MGLTTACPSCGNPNTLSGVCCVHCDYDLTEISAEDQSLISYEPTAAMRESARVNNDVLGWQQRWWGMTEPELLKILGTRLQKLSSRKMYDRTYVDHQITGYTVGAIVFRIKFQMDDLTHRLVQVLFKATNLGRLHSTEGSVRQSVELLTEKYGSPKCIQQDDTLWTTFRWIFQTTTIELHFQPQTPSLSGLSPASLLIRYFPSPASEADKF